ncbi:carboxypeptidase B-like [Anneissia japonica]|uniref:carboxypeptidase B-like n=1 Tax=Anneissia japonica TaxID=1529436 RepID=UPI001425734F|nr:carboxypeptidase B-like [Anneissia japonica]
MNVRLLVLATAIVLCSAEPRKYDGYKLLRITPTNENEIQMLTKLKSVIQDKVDFWKDIRATGSPVDIMVPPQMVATVLAITKEYNLIVDIVIEDIQPLIDDQMRHSREMSAKGIIIQLGSGRNKPIVWLEGGIHSREWVSPATMIYMTHELVSNYKKDTDITSMMDSLDFYIIPVFNVDGYHYTWNGDRMWRKTRSPNSGSSCVGTDPNRNWDWHWSEPGASRFPCNDAYYGSSAFSEIEVKSVTDYMASLKDIRVFIDFHAYSQMWMSTWSYTKDLPISSDYNDQINLQSKAVEALTAVYGTKYTHGTVANTIYEASGSSIDWAYGKLGIKYSYAVELRDTGLYGFTLPDRYIEPTAIETFEAVKVIAKHVM